MPKETNEVANEVTHYMASVLEDIYTLCNFPCPLLVLLVAHTGFLCVNEVKQRSFLSKCCVEISSTKVFDITYVLLRLRIISFCQIVGVSIHSYFYNLPASMCSSEEQIHHNYDVIYLSVKIWGKRLSFWSLFYVQIFCCCTTVI